VLELTPSWWCSAWSDDRGSGNDATGKAESTAVGTPGKRTLSEGLRPAQFIGNSLDIDAADMATLRDER
jgi:hypothetical protein